MRTTLPALIALLALCGLSLAAPARACSLPPTGWYFNGFGPRDATARLVMPPEGPLVIGGESFFFEPVDLAAFVAGRVAVVVRDADGEPVPGRLVRLPAGDDFGWYPDAALPVGERFGVEVSVPEDDFELGLWDEGVAEFEVVDPPAAPRVSVRGGRLEAYDADITEACVGDFDSCGGCSEQAVIGSERRWQITMTYEAEAGLYDGSRSTRRAVGADAAEAFAVLDRTSPTPSFGAGRRDVAGGGAVDGWYGHEACLAIEVRDVYHGVLARDVFCDVVPGAEPGGRVDPLAAPEAEGEGGCAVSGAGGGSGAGLWALLLGGLLLGRRRALLALGLLASLAGCDGSEGGGPVEPVEPVEPPDMGVVHELPPLAPSVDVPPISGGTLAVAGSARVAVVADPDRDRVLLVALDARRIIAEVEAPGEPGRVVVDEARGVAHVALRSGGAVLTVGLDGEGAMRHPVCAAPRGLALEGDRLHVACAGGWLWTLGADGRALRRVAVAPDLRDVVVAGGRVHVSRFRSAELITLDADGAIVGRRRPASDDPLYVAQPAAPVVAWRTIGLPDGRVVMLHQRALLSAVPTEEPGGYGRGSPSRCGGSIVTTALTTFDADPQVAPTGREVAARTAVTVDVAMVGDALVLAAPGNTGFVGRGRRATLLRVFDDGRSSACLGFEDLPAGSGGEEVTAVADDGGVVVALRREPPALLVGDAIVELPGASVYDTGHALFHRATDGGIACASCHPEGSEDGHAWLFEGHGLRRTQELRGGIAGSEPFHWTGDMRDFGHLMDEVMTVRMSGPTVPPEYADALLGWIDRLPVEAADAMEAGDAIAGAAVFADPMVGCTACHSGPRLSDGARYDVGTGGVFETATLLGIGRRGSLMHDGCGASLADRFDAGCGGGDDHGRTSHLSAGEIADLVAYLETL